MVTRNNIPEHFIPSKEYKYIHVFTDGKDEYLQYDEVNLSYNQARKDAQEIANKWIKNGEENIRIYDVYEIDELGVIETIQENLIFQMGEYPA